MQRHEILRLAMPPRAFANGLAVLRPAETITAWSELDWCEAPADAAERALSELLDRDRVAGFDFHAGPLIRMTLIRRSATHTWLLASNHHALLDGWSMPVLIAELLLAYQDLPFPRRSPGAAFSDGSPPTTATRRQRSGPNGCMV